MVLSFLHRVHATHQLTVDMVPFSLQPTVDMVPSIQPTVDMVPSIQPTVDMAPSIQPIVDMAPSHQLTVAMAPSHQHTVVLDLLLRLPEKRMSRLRNHLHKTIGTWYN